MRILLFSRWGEQIGELTGITQATWTEVLNGEDTVKLICDRQVSKGQRLVWRDSMGRWHEHIVTEAKDVHDNGGLRCEVVAENSILELFWNHISSLRIANGLAIEALMVALGPTRWDIGAVNSTNVASLECYRLSCREALAKIIETWNVELRTDIEASGLHVTKRTLGLVRRGTDKGMRFEWGHDLTGIERTVSADDVVSAMIGYGKVDQPDGGGEPVALTFASINDGLIYVWDDAVRDEWGRPGRDGSKEHVFGVAEFSDCDDPHDLLARTRRAFDAAKVPQVSYGASVASFNKAGIVTETAELGDAVTIIDRDFSETLRFKGRITKTVRDLLDGERLQEMVIGTICATVTDIFTKQDEAIRSINNRSGSWNAAASTLGSSITDSAGGSWDLMRGTMRLKTGSDTSENMTISAETGVTMNGQRGITCDLVPIARARFINGICVEVEQEDARG